MGDNYLNIIYLYTYVNIKKNPSILVLIKQLIVNLYITSNQ